MKPNVLAGTFRTLPPTYVPESRPGRTTCAHGTPAPSQGRRVISGADEKQGPLWKMFVVDLDTAKLKAQQFAIDERVEFFVYSFRDCSEVARFFPEAQARSLAAQSLTMVFSKPIVLADGADHA